MMSLKGKILLMSMVIVSYNLILAHNGRAKTTFSLPSTDLTSPALTSHQPNPTYPIPEDKSKITDDPKQILARVANTTITVADVKKIADVLPKEMQSLPKELLYPQLIKQIAFDRAIDHDIQLSSIATKENVKNDIAASVKEAKHTTLLKAYFVEKLKPALTHQAIQDYYQKHYVATSSVPEVHLQQITVQTKTIAEMVLNELKQNKNFDDLAVTYSIDLAYKYKNKGDLGWFTKRELPKNLADIAFSLTNNGYNHIPIQTNYGWVIIKKLGERTKTPPPLTEVEQTIREKITTDKVDDIYRKSLEQNRFIQY